MTTSAKKASAVIFILFLILFTAYKPYDQPIYGDTFLKQLFVLYSFILNQTFGMIHEAGHGVCYIARCPDFITAANGTLFQLLFPFVPGVISKRQGNVFGFYIGLFFVGFSMQYTAWYISTAHEGLYVSAANSFLGKDGYHDFNYILSTFNLVGLDRLIGGLVKFGGYIMMMYACFRMWLLAFVNKGY
ncbi:MAG: hypothetical protein LBQ18_02980 [Campylobacteraceae bacterium]|jgi:hypothetical protein|nr:hypothetical protein [Campylobacteraceae bacterium]